MREGRREGGREESISYSPRDACSQRGAPPHERPRPPFQDDIERRRIEDVEGEGEDGRMEVAGGETGFHRQSQ